MTDNIDKEFLRETDGKQDNLSLVTEKGKGRGSHPNSRDNLQPFEKGVSGNPDGRPKKYVKLKKSLNKVGSINPNQWDKWSTDGDYKDEVVKRIWYEASLGSISHIKILAELGCLDDED
jgi:hypothetical protein